MFRVLGVYNFGLGQNSKNNFVCFLIQMRTRKFASEINWPLGLLKADQELEFSYNSCIKVHILVQNLNKCRSNLYNNLFETKTETNLKTYQIML